jgi:hypothetical protein
VLDENSVSHYNPNPISAALFQESQMASDADEDTEQIILQKNIQSNPYQDFEEHDENEYISIKRDSL